MPYAVVLHRKANGNPFGTGTFVLWLEVWWDDIDKSKEGEGGGEPH